MIFITGHHCTGKTYITNALYNYGFEYIDSGPFLRSLWRKQAVYTAFEKYINENEKIFGKHFTDQLLSKEISKIIQKLKNNKKLDILVTGNRTIEGIHYIKDHCVDLKSRRKIIFYIEADKQILYSRYCQRNNSISISEFEEVLDKDKAMGLEKIKPEADFIITNNSTINNFRDNVFDIVFRELGFPKNYTL